MGGRATYTVVEVFQSVQGEGLRSGELAVFVRLAGCNLRCPWCDTPQALSATGHRRMGLDQLIKRIEQAGQAGHAASGRYVVLTGGEPGLQPLGPLVDRLHAAGCSVGIETNGTVGVPHSIDWLTVSPKPPQYKIEPSLVGRISELKLVVDDPLAFETAQQVWDAAGRQTPVVLQPESNRPEMAARIISWLKREPRWRMGIQLHKVIGVR